MPDKILIVDDEREIADLVSLYLENEKYIVFKCYDAQSALECIEREKLDLAILDVLLPDMSGFEICKRIRERHNYPIIMLTAKVSEVDKITGLTLGADDYITKPFLPLEMVARVKAQLRRYKRYNTGAPQEDDLIVFGGLFMNEKTRECTLNEKPLSLTPTEFAILKILCLHKGNIVSSEELFHQVWGDEYYNNSNNNVLQIKSAMPSNCQLMAVVKADAYGHNAYHIATCLQSVGVNAFAVATIDEGISLRQYGITGEILVLGYTSPDRAKELVQHNLFQTLIDYGYAQELEKQGVNIKAHIKIDTGMHRLGYDVADFGSICNTFMMPHIQVEGIYTHLCVADSKDDSSVQFTQNQIESFRKLLRSLPPSGIETPKIHIQSSYGLLNYPGLDCDYVRAGIALYGTYSSPDEGTKLRLDLRPVLSLKSRVILIRTIAKGDTVGYRPVFNFFLHESSPPASSRVRVIVPYLCGRNTDCLWQLRHG